MKQRQVLQLTAFLLLLLFIGIAFYDFKKQAYIDTRNANEVRSRETTEQIADTVKTKLDSSLRYIKSTAKAFGRYDDVHSEKSLELLTQMSENSPFDRMWITNGDYKTISANQEIFYDKQGTYLSKALAGEYGITALMTSIYNDKPIISFYAPIAHDGEYIGMLQGVYETEQMAKALNLNNFGGEGVCYIFQKDGAIVASSWDEKVLTSKSNILTWLEAAKHMDGSDYETFYSNIQSGERGSLTTEVDGQKHYATYQSVGIGDLFVMNVIPQSVIEQQQRGVNNAAIMLMSKMAVAFLVVLAVSVYIARRSQQTIKAAYAELSYLNDNLPGGIHQCTADDAYEFGYVSKGYLNMLCVSREELASLYKNRFINTVLPEDREYVQQELKKVLTRNESISLKYRLNTKDGSLLWVSDQRHLITEEDKQYYFCAILDITETKRIENELRISVEQFKIAIAQTEQIVFEYDPLTHNLNYIEENDAYEQKIGLKIASAPEGVLESDIIFPEYKDGFIYAYEQILSGAPHADCTIKIRPPQRENMWVKITLTNIYDENGHAVKAMGVMQDVTREVETQLRLEQAESHRDAIMGETIFSYEFNLSKGTSVTTGTVKKLNEDFYPAEEYLVANPNRELVHPDDQKALGELFSTETMWAIYRSDKQETKRQCRIKNRMDNWVWVECTVHFMMDIATDDIIGTVYIKNINDQKVSELVLQSKAERDALTGLYDRISTEERIAYTLQQPLAKEKMHAFLILDIDRFKEINDTYGHTVGDVVLRQIAAIMNTQFRKTDVVGRLGGDEFVTFLAGVDSKELIASKAQDFCEAVRKLKVEGEAGTHISMSIGIAVAPAQGSTFQELYSKADKALYTAKENGRDNYVFYEEASL